MHAFEPIRFAPKSRGLRARAPMITLLLFCLSCVGTTQASGSEAAEARLRAPHRGIGFSLVDFDLPLDFQARVGGLYTRYRHGIDALAYNRRMSPGPAVQRDSLIESRISIGREVVSGVEVEVAWAAQTPISFRSMSTPDQQTLGAYIRFRH